MNSLQNEFYDPGLVEECLWCLGGVITSTGTKGDFHNSVTFTS